MKRISVFLLIKSHRIVFEVLWLFLVFGSLANFTVIEYNYGIISPGEEIMNDKIRTKTVERLFDAVLSLENKEECMCFFEDLCTVNELLSLSQRFEVARMLRQKKTYLEIADKTGASTATISRVNRSLNYGNGAYDMVFERIPKAEEKDNDA